MNVWVKDPEVTEFCQQHDIRLMAYSPLGYAYATMLLQDDTLQRIASELNATPAQIALAWLMKQGIAVIPKSASPQRLAENIQAQNWVSQLTEEHMSMLDAIAPPEYLTDFLLIETAAHAKSHGDIISWEPPTSIYKS